MGSLFTRAWPSSTAASTSTRYPPASHRPSSRTGAASGLCGWGGGGGVAETASPCRVWPSRPVRISTPIPQHQGPRRLGGGLFLPGLAADLPHAPPQAQAHQPEQDAQGPGYGRLQPGDQPGQDGAHDDGIAPPQRRQGYGQPPAAAQAAVLLPQGPEPQHQQDAANHGQKMLQIPEVQGDAGQSDAPQNAAHGLPPGGHPAAGSCSSGSCSSRVCISRSKRMSSVTAGHLPNRFRSLCRRRYSRPSAARSVMPSSAAIWAVDWQ